MQQVKFCVVIPRVNQPSGGTSTQQQQLAPACTSLVEGVRQHLVEKRFSGAVLGSTTLRLNKVSIIIINIQISVQVSYNLALFFPHPVSFPYLFHFHTGCKKNLAYKVW